MTEDQTIQFSRRLEAISDAIDGFAGILDEFNGPPTIRELFVAATLAGSAWAKKENGLLIDPALAARRAVEIADAAILAMEGVKA